mgnify:CR=1 FL=1
MNIPTVAVVGYTNAGKTSLIKALTKDESLKPKNQLFATLGTMIFIENYNFHHLLLLLLL